MQDNSVKQADREAVKRKEVKWAMRERVVSVLLGMTGIGLFLLIWHCAAHFEWIDKRLIVEPLQVFSTLVKKLTDTSVDGATLFEHIASSLVVSMSGFSVAVCIGVPMGLLMGWYKPFDRFVRPVFELIRPIPPISWIPITIILLGIGLEAKAIIIFFAAFIPSLINSYTGIRMANPVLVNVAKTCGASKWTTFLRVGIPSAMPMAFAGMRISLGNAWGTLVAAEMLAANKGVGYMITMGRNFLKIDLIMAGMLVIGLMGVIFAFIFDVVEKIVLKWRVE